MKDSGPWTNDDFEQMSWHDVHVHGFRLESFDEELGTADFLLDIDYILAWENIEGTFQFTVCQAALRFQGIFGLKLVIDYATPTAGMSALSLAEIRREPLTYHTGHNTYRWHLAVNWPQGYIEFEAPGFTQTLVGEPHVQAEQSLSQEHRRTGVAV